MPEFKKTPRSTVERLPERSDYDRESANAILDEGLVAHVGFAGPQGPVVIPMAYARDGDQLLLHGSVVSRLMKALAEGIEVSVCVTLLDGMVLARSTFHHSMNYRSVVIFGRARLINDPKEKAHALEQLVEHIVPGRGADARGANRKETNATTMLKLPIAEASTKIRSGPPKDAKADLELPVWSGVIPFSLAIGTPESDEFTPGDMAVPDYVASYSRS